MNRTQTLLLRGLLVAGALSISAAVASGQDAEPPLNPTHYWTYKLLAPVSGPYPVTAWDQFYPDGVTLTVDRLDRLVNWVSKNGSPVQPDTLLHYTWWNVQPKLPTPRAVRVINQFGDYNVSVQNLEFMLVPAWKNQPQPIQPNANHYLCYRAFGFPPPPFGVTLFDEWRQDQQQPQEMEYLCNPCRKDHAGRVYPVVNPSTHFALFRIPPVSDPFTPFIQDQFFSGTVPVRQSPYEYLLVPSLKTDIPTPTQTISWGRLKTIYR